MKHGHFLAFFSIVRVLFRQWGDFLDFGEGIGSKNKIKMGCFAQQKIPTATCSCLAPDLFSSH
jgi:hypothetical protein